MRCLAMMLALMIGGGAAPSSAQFQPVGQRLGLRAALHSLGTDSYIRVALRDSTYAEGYVVAVDADSLALQTLGLDGQSITLGIQDVRRLWEVKASKRRGRVTGVVMGGALGAFLGWTAAITIQIYLCGSNCSLDDPIVTKLTVGAIGGILGAMLGWEIGSAVTPGTQQWIERYPNDNSTGVMAPKPSRWSSP